jgi:hypothetical protein
MSCDACSDAQALRGPELGQHYYVRVGNANVEIVGCKEHVGWAITLIRNGLRDTGILFEERME